MYTIKLLCRYTEDEFILFHAILMNSLCLMDFHSKSDDLAGIIRYFHKGQSICLRVSLYGLLPKNQNSSLLSYSISEVD